jgi:hypothetical protein
LTDLLHAIEHNIPHPLGNVTRLLREAGLDAMAEKADRQFVKEGAELENLRTDRSDCQTDDCVAKIDLKVQKITEVNEKVKIMGGGFFFFSYSSFSFRSASTGCRCCAKL